jgi:DNA-binding CsgD family transcriptional regulator
MTATQKTAMRRLLPLLLLIAVQFICIVVFLADVVKDLTLVDRGRLAPPEILAEVAATIGLILGLVFEGVVLARLVRERARMQQSLSAASGALADLMQRYFTNWGLTATESDVAAFTIKGFSITEIAAFRGSAEGTIKTHLNAIYRKSGVSGRAQLISVLVEDLFETPLLTGNGGLPVQQASVG